MGKSKASKREREQSVRTDRTSRTASEERWKSLRDRTSRTRWGERERERERERAKVERDRNKCSIFVSMCV